VSGEGGPELAAQLREVGRERGVEVTGPDGGGGFMVRGPDHGALCDALAVAARPAARVRVEVDPRRA
jgi:hypothetical protein